MFIGGDGHKIISLNVVVALKFRHISLLSKVVDPEANEMSIWPWKSANGLGILENISWVGAYLIICCLKLFSLFYFFRLFFKLVKIIY